MFLVALGMFFLIMSALHPENNDPAGTLARLSNKLFELLETNAARPIDL